MDLSPFFSDHRPPNTNLVDCLRYWTDVQPSAVAYYFTDGEQLDEQITYQELDRRARAIAVRLGEAGLAGRPALLLYPSGLDFVAAFFGCLYAGVVAAPAYPPRRNRYMARIQAISDDADAAAVLTTRAVADRSADSLGEAPSLERLPWIATDETPEELADQWRGRRIRSDDLAALQYTSGSTGAPKGVMLSHGNMMHNVQLITYAFEPTREGVGLTWLPIYHDMGLVGGVLKPLYYGRPNVLMSPMAFLQKPVRWLRAITRRRVSISGGPNFAYDLCVKKISPEQLDGLDLSTWDVAFNGAEPIRAETLERFVERFGPVGFRREAFFPCYGMAETTLIVTGGPKAAPFTARSFNGRRLDQGRVEPADPADPDGRVLVGCGRVLPDEEIVLVDPETRRLLPPGQVGEIWVRGPSVAKGYWRNEEATQETFHARPADAPERGPFLRTGDLGFLHEGELFVTGRLKDVIIIRGVNKYPQDIELTVERASPWIQDGAVGAFAVEAEGQERLVVVGEVDRKRRKEYADVILAIRRAVAAEHDTPPDAVVLVRFGSIPKTSSGKIQRHLCRQEFLEGRLKAVAQWRAWGPQGAEREPEDTTARQRPSQGGAADASPSPSRPATSRGLDRLDPWRRIGAASQAPWPGRDALPAASAAGRATEPLDLATFDYLGLAAHPAVRQAAAAALARPGACAAAIRRLERSLAGFLGAESAVVSFDGSRLTAWLAALLGPEDLVLFDSQCGTASRTWAAGAVCAGRTAPSGGWDCVASWIASHSPGRVWVVVEGLSSRTGCLAELPRWFDLKARHDLLLLVDETHSLGVWGPHGRGVVEHWDLDGRLIDFWAGALGPAFGAGGRFLAGRRDLLDGLRAAAPARAGLLEAAAAAAAARALGLLEEDPERAARALGNAQRFAATARGLGAPLHGAGPLFIVPLGGLDQTAAVARRLADDGVLVRTVAQAGGSEAALQLAVSAAHEPAELERAAAKLAAAVRGIAPERLREASSPAAAPSASG